MTADIDPSSILISLAEVRIIIGSLVAGILTLFGYFWQRSVKCEARHEQLETEVRELKGKIGFLSGIAEIIATCSTAGCAFKDKIPTYSIANLRKTGTTPPP